MNKQREEVEGYWCVACMRFIEADEHGVIVHDEGIDHENMTFDEERNPQ